MKLEDGPDNPSGRGRRVTVVIEQFDGDLGVTVFDDFRDAERAARQIELESPDSSVTVGTHTVNYNPKENT